MLPSSSSRQLSQRLARERQVILGAEQVRRILKKADATQPFGQQKSISQKTRKGRRINIMGVWEQEKRLEYALRVGTDKTKNYLRFMDWQAERAIDRLFETGKPTVIIHDNASIHRAELAKQHHQLWSKQGLSVFSLPPYSPEMNRIEEQWLHLKRQELDRKGLSLFC